MDLIVDSGITLDQSYSNAGTHGWGFTTNKVCTLKVVTKHSSSTATKVKLMSVALVELASSTFVGNDATFNYIMDKDTKYFLMCHKDGAAFTQRYAIGTFPYYRTNIIIDAGAVSGGDDPVNIYNVDSITTASLAISTLGQKELKTSWDELTSSDSTKAIGHEQSIKAEQSYILARDRL